MAPFKPYNFCLKYFFVKCIVYEIFDRSGTFLTPCICVRVYECVYEEKREREREIQLETALHAAQNHIGRDRRYVNEAE